MIEYLTLSNISLVDRTYLINDHIKLIKPDTIEPETTLVIDEGEKSTSESNGIIFYNALRLAFPKVNIYIKPEKEKERYIYYRALKDRNSYLINYYAIGDNNYDKFIHMKDGKTKLVDIYNHPSIQIDSSNIEHLKKVHNIIIYKGTKQSDLRKQSVWKPTRWSFALNQYEKACRELSLETSIMYLISALESLLSKNSGELTYKVSLFSSLVAADTKEQRKEIFKLVHTMYSIRSKVSHGDIENVYKLMTKESIYHDYFNLKDVVAKIILKLYDMEPQKVFDKIDDLIYESPAFT